MKENINETNNEEYEIPVQEQYNSLIEELKVDLNNFLYSKMPPSMTLIEFENLSIEIFKLINEEWIKRIK